ncbi:hypothetical protein JHK87_053151 [Glycine soja]|nr:hypothetical protein JHK87_053151 [Glycine soja]
MENIFFEEEKMIFAQLPDKYVKTKALLEASNQHKQLLCEQIPATFVTNEDIGPGTVLLPSHPSKIQVPPETEIPAATLC